MSILFSWKKKKRKEKAKLNSEEFAAYYNSIIYRFLMPSRVDCSMKKKQFFDFQFFDIWRFINRFRLKQVPG